MSVTGHSAVLRPSGGVDLAEWIWSGGFDQVDLLDSTKNPVARNEHTLSF